MSAQMATARIGFGHAPKGIAGGPSQRLGRALARALECRPVNRFQKLAPLTLATALGLVTIGVIVRATDSGLGCPDWPFCYGQLLPPAGDPKAWIEWIHRTVAALIGFEILGLAVLALRDHRTRRSILWPTFGAVGLVGFQAWLGRETVRLGNSGESVTAHLAAALPLVGLLVFLTVRAGYPARLAPRRRREPALHPARGLRRRGHLRPAAVRIAGHRDRLGPRLPGLAADGRLARPAADRRDRRARAPSLGRRGRRPDRARIAVVAPGGPSASSRRSSGWPSARRGLFAIQVAIGGAQVLTRLDAWTQTLHLALGAVIWATLAGLTVTSYYAARVAAVRRSPAATIRARPVGRAGRAATRSGPTSP